MTAQRWIFLADGPRNGEHVLVDVGPDGNAPSEVTILNPPADPTTVPKDTPDSTTYKRIDVVAGPKSPPLIYQSTIVPDGPPRQSDQQPQIKPH